MSYDYTADTLLLSIRDVVQAGASNRDWSDTQLLRLVNRQIQEYLLPFVIRTRKEDFIASADQPLVGGTAAYRIPSRATAARIRAVQLVDSSGNAYSSLQEISLEDAINLTSPALLGSSPQATPTNYYFQGNQIVLVPTPPTLAGIFLRVYFPARPSTLALQANFIQITGFPGGAASGFFRVGIGAAVPGGYGANVSCDLVQNVPGFDILYTGTVNALTAGSYVEFAGTLPTGLAVGDWVCISGTAPVITGAVAEVTTGCLVNKVALEILASKTDDEGFSMRGKLLAKSEAEAERLLLPNRNMGERPKAGAGALYRFRRGGGCP